MAELRRRLWGSECPSSTTGVRTSGRKRSYPVLPVAAVVLGVTLEPGWQGGEDGMTVQIPVVHEHQKESSNSLLFSSPSRGTCQRIADIDADIGVPSTPSTMERIMLQPSSGPDYLRLFPPVASCEPQAKNRWRWRSRFPIWTDSSR